MKKVIVLLILSMFIQHSSNFGMLFKKNPIKLQKKVNNKIKLCSNKTAEFNYDLMMFNALQQITSLKQENTSLKLTIEMLLAQTDAFPDVCHTKHTLAFTSEDQRSSKE